MFKRKTETPKNNKVTTEMQLENNESTTKGRYAKWGKYARIGIAITFPIITFAAGFGISHHVSGEKITVLHSSIDTLLTTNENLQKSVDNYKKSIDTDYILIDSYQDLQEKYTGLQNDYSELSDKLLSLESEKAKTEDKYRKLVQTVQTTEKQKSDTVNASVVFDEYDVRKISGASVATLNKILAGTWLEGYGQVFYDNEQQYGVNALFSIGNTILEAGWDCDSWLANNKNNIYGLATDRYFESKASCINYWFDLIANHYVDDGLISIARINEKYCPPNSRWSSDIVWIVKKLTSNSGITLN